MRKYWGGIRYFDLYGYVALAYDAGREVLQLSACLLYTSRCV